MPLKSNTPPRLADRLRISFVLAICCLVMLAAATGAKAWGAPGIGSTVNPDDGYYAQMSVTAPVRISGELDPTTGDIAFAGAQVQNNSACMDIVADSASFHAADGVSGDWKATLGGKTAMLPLDGLDAGFGVEIARGTSSELSLDTTFSGIDAGKMVDRSLGSLTLAFSEKKEAFAVYNDDDKSLTFYKRGTKPASGSVYKGKAATAIYTGFETIRYAIEGEDGQNVPWSDIRKQVESVSVADDGVKPLSAHGWFSQMENLAACDLGKLDTSGCDDLSSLFSGCGKLASIEGLGQWDTSACTTMGRMFCGCKNLAEIGGLENWDVHSVESMERMFDNCEKLQRVDVSNFKGESLASAHAMFFHCYALTSLTLPNLITSSCSNIGCIFDGCIRLETIYGIEQWDVSGVDTCYQVFYSCEKLRAVDLSCWRLKPSDNAQAMFFGCYALKNLDLSGFDFSQVARATQFFSSCVSLEKVTFGNDWRWAGDDGFLPAPNRDYIGDADGKWYDAATGDAYASAEVPAGVGTYMAVNPKTAFAVFSADDGSLDFYKRMSVPEVGSQFEGKTVTEIYTGFETLEASSQADVPWATLSDKVSSVSVDDQGIAPMSMAYWFFGFESLVHFDGNNLDTQGCTSLENLFEKSHNLVAVEVSNWNLATCQSVAWAFADCYKLSNVKVSNWNLFACVNMQWVFEDCTCLSNLDVAEWSVGNCTNFNGAFEGCHQLTGLDLSKWDIKPGATFDYLFAYDKSLNELKLNNFDTATSTTNGMLAGCEQLREISVSDKWIWRGDEQLPAPSFATIDGADGKWYAASDGAGYAPADIPSGKADTYYAVAPSAFAVYSADDGSLDFYKRAGRPSVGDVWQGKAATAVYTGIETEDYRFDQSSDRSTVPWSDRRAEVRSVAVKDSIKPASLCGWFYRFENCESIELGSIDTSAVNNYFALFDRCRKVRELDVSMFDTSSADSYGCMFFAMDSLSSLDISNFDLAHANMSYMFSNCVNLSNLKLTTPEYFIQVYWRCAFNECRVLSLDCSSWNVPSTAEVDHDHFNYNAPGVILPKPWQPTAFAVYSADDASLDFYKRERSSIPADGSTWQGKAATKVYADFEDKEFTGTWPDSDCPWLEQRGNVKSVAVVDEGIRPVSMAWWFNQYSKCESFDLGKLDTGRCKSLERMFSSCGACTLLTGLENWDTSSVEDLSAAFDGMHGLSEIPGISDWYTSSVKTFGSCFYNCQGLVAVDISGWTDSAVVKNNWSGKVFGFTGSGYTKLASVKVGAGWSNTAELLCNSTKSLQCPDADGNWYAASTGNAYAAGQAPGGKADTYYTSKAALDAAPPAATRDASGWSLDSYKRADGPVAGEVIEGRTENEAYAGVEERRYESVRDASELNRNAAEDNGDEPAEKTKEPASIGESARKENDDAKGA